MRAMTSADETLVGALFHAAAGAKVQGLDAALAGGLASLVAQCVTTPVTRIDNYRTAMQA